MGDVEFERRVQEEARALEDRFRKHNGTLEDSWTAAVRPLVERLAAAEGERAREAKRADAAETRYAERETECQTLAEEIGREREERAKREEGPRIPELEARIVALDRERSAALDELAKTWRRVVAAEDAVGDLEARTAGLEGERDEALSTVRRYEVQLAHVVGREATLRSALADARAGLRSMARELLGVDAGRAVVEVGS